MNWKEFKGTYSSCEECPRHLDRRKVVLFRGSWNAEVLFLEEAPNKMSDLNGKPFQDNGGRLIEDLLQQSDLKDTKVGFSNIACCIGYKDDGGIRPVGKKEAVSCSGRLLAMLDSVKPKVLVAVGKPVVAHIEKLVDVDKYSVYRMPHPAVMLRMDQVQQGVSMAKSLGLMNDIAWELEQ